MSSGGGAAGGVRGLDLNYDTVPILDDCEAGVEDALVSAGGLVLERERGATLEGVGDEKKECESGVAGREDGMFGTGKGSGGSDFGGESEDSAVGTIIREAAVESHVGKLLKVDLGEKESTEFAVFSTAGLEAAEASRRAVGDGLEGSSIFRKEEIVVQVGLVDGGEQAVDGKLGLEDLEAEGVSHGVKLLEVVTVERESKDLVDVSGKEFEDAEAGNQSMISKDGSGIDQKQGMDINADGMIKDDELGPREREAEVKTYNVKFLEFDKEEEGSPGLVAVSTEGFGLVEENSNSVNSHDGPCGDQMGGIDFDAKGMVIDDEFDSQKMKVEVVSLGGQLLELKKWEKESTEVVSVSADKVFGPVNASSQSMELVDESDTIQMLETDLDAKGMVEPNDDSVSVSGSYDGKVLESNEGKGSEELVPILTEGFGPVKASNQAIYLVDGSGDVQILGTNVDTKHTNEAIVSISGGTCLKLLDSDKEDKGSAERFDISTDVFQPVKASSQSIDLTEVSCDVQMAVTDVDAKGRLIINEDSVSSSFGAGVKLLELYNEEKGIADLVAISTKMLEPVTANSPAIDLADGSGEVQIVGTDVDAKGTVRISEDYVCISSVSGGKLLELDEEKGTSELVAISSEVLEPFKGCSQGIDLTDESSNDERQGTDSEAGFMVGINEDSNFISVCSGGKLLELEREEKESIELVDTSTEVFERVETSSQSIVLGDPGDDQRLGTDVESVVIIRNNEVSVTISSDGEGPKDERLAMPLFMLKEQDEVLDDLEDGRRHVVEDELGTGNREDGVKSCGEGCLEVDMLEKRRTELVAASTECSGAVDARAVDMGDGSVDDQEQGTDVDTMVMAGTDDPHSVLVSDGGPGSERLEGSLTSVEEKYEVHVDLVDGSCQVLDDQSCVGEREAEVESHGGVLFEVETGGKEKSDLVAVSAEEFEAIEANNQIMNLEDDSFGGWKQGIDVDGKGFVLDGQLGPGERDAELKSHSRKFFEVNKETKGSAELVAFSTEGFESVVSSSYAMYFGDGSDSDDEGGADLAAEAMAIEGEFCREADFQSHERNILEFDSGEKGSAELFSVSSEEYENVKDTTEAMEMGDGSVGDQNLVANIDAETMVTTDKDSTILSVVSGGSEDERLEESLFLRKEQIKFQGDLVNRSCQVVHGELSTVKWEDEVRPYGEKPVEVDLGKRESSKLVSASTEWSEVVESSNQAMHLQDGSNSDKKQEIDDGEDIVGNEVSVTVSVPVESLMDERLEASLASKNELVEVLDHLVDGCCQVVDSEKGPGERGNELESHDGGLLKVVLGEKRMELIAISAERFGTVEVISQGMELGDNSDGYQAQGIDVNAESMVGSSDDSILSPGIGVPEHERFEESSVLGIDHVEVLEKSVDGCGQVAKSELIHGKRSLVVEAYDDKLLKVETEDKGGAELFAVLSGRPETVEACSEAMDLKDGPHGDQKLEIGVDANCMVGTSEDSLNVSAAGCDPKDEILERSLLLEKEHIEVHEDIMDNCDQVLDDVLDRQKREVEVELDAGEIGSAELASVSTGGFYAVVASSQDTDFEDGYSTEQKLGSNIDSKSIDGIDEDSATISVDCRGIEDEMFVLSSNLVKEEVEVGEGTNKIKTAVEDFFAQLRKTEVVGVDTVILASQVQTEYGDHVLGLSAEATIGRNEDATCTVSAGDGGSEDGRLETSYMFGENQVDVEEDNSKPGSSKEILAHPEKVGGGEVVALRDAGHIKDTVHCEHVENLGSKEEYDGENMPESCVEADAVPMIAPVTCQMLEKVAHGESSNADVIEEHPCEMEGEIVGVEGHNQSVVNSEFSVGDQNLISKGLACLPECVEQDNDSMDHLALDETVVTYQKRDISLGTFKGSVLELIGGEPGLAHHSLVDSNQVDVHTSASSVENCQKMYDKISAIACETVQSLDSIPINEELVSGSHEMDGNMKITVSGNSIVNCDVSKTKSLDAVTNMEEGSACRHTIDNNTLAKGDVVLEDNGLVTIITPAEQQKAIEQQNFANQNQKEDSSSMMVSFRGEEAHGAVIIEDSNSVFGISIPDASAELDNPTFSPQLNEPSVGCQDVQPPDIPSMEHDKLEPENGVDEATNCCQSLQGGKSEHLKESHNQSEGCDDASTESSSTSQQATYNLFFPEKEGFSTSDLVWGKVKSHPWWPGQIFDFTGASKLALKYQKKDHFLVAYFGDKTFAWCEESRLKPFQPYFSQMEKQTSSDSFLRALHDILVEISRRVELSMTCLCLPEETFVDIEYQKVENAGVRGKTVNSVVDRYEIVNCFYPDNLLDYIRDLSQFPKGGADRLELTIAQAQLKSFVLFKGYTELPSFTNGSGLVENDFEIPTSMNKSLKEDELDHSATLKDLFSTKVKSRVRDGTLGNQTHIVEDGRKQKNMSELMEEETTFFIVNGNENSPSAHGNERCLSSDNKRKAAGYFSDDFERMKAKKINPLANKETMLPSPTFSSSFKVGEFISRAASKLTCGQPLRKCYVEKSDDWTIDYLDIDDFLDFPFDNPKLQIDISEEYPPANEMLSKLCLAARNPLKGYNFSSIVISFFSAFRNLQVCNFSLEMNKTEKPRAKRGRKKKVIPDSELPDTPDHMKDSYWSDMIVPEKDAILNTPKRRGRKKRKFNGESSPPQMLNSPSDCDSKLHTGSMCPHVKHICIAERPIISIEEKIVEERTPTAVILYFNCSDSLPSDIDLIRIFSRYGPLKEDETSIEIKTNSAMVVFKKRADAEMAFSSAGKFSTFGPALLSYRLRHFPANSSPANALKAEDHATLIKDSKIGISAEPEPESALDGNLCEKIPPVRLEGVDRGPSYFSQTQQDACNTHVEIGCAGEFSDPSMETGTVPDNLRLESFDQELSYFDLDMAECGHVSGNMEVENHCPAGSGVILEMLGTEDWGEKSSTFLPDNAEILEVSHAESPMLLVTRTSDSLSGQLQDRMALKNASQHEALDQELYTTSSRAEVKNVQDELAISPSQPVENICPDSAPAHVGTGTSQRSSVAIDAMEIPAISEEPSNSQGEKSYESVPDKKIVDSTQATAVSDSTYVRGKIEESPESNVAEADTGSV